MEIQRIGIIGVGLMGAGIAEVCARAGYDTLVREINDELLARGLDRIETSMQSAVQRGKLTSVDQEAARSRVRGTTRLEDFADRDLVIEAAIEHVRTLTTSDESLETVRAVGERLGKRMIVSKDRAGFIVNYLLVPYMLDAVHMLEQGFASKEDIDVGMMLGTSYPMGPFTLADFVGLDTAVHIADVLFDAFKEPRFAAPTLLRQMVAAGWLGRKSGRGFYHYKAGEKTPH